MFQKNNMNKIKQIFVTKDLRFGKVAPKESQSKDVFLFPLEQNWRYPQRELDKVICTCFLHKLTQTTISDTYQRRQQTKVECRVSISVGLDVRISERKHTQSHHHLDFESNCTACLCERNAAQMRNFAISRLVRVRQISL